MSNLKNFELRYLFPSKYKTIKNKDKTISTHKMADAEVDGKFIAYPTIIQMEGNEDLIDLGQTGSLALDYALKTGEFKEFNTEKEAREYASNGYKKLWGLGEQKNTSSKKGMFNLDE